MATSRSVGCGRGAGGSGAGARSHGGGAGMLIVAMPKSASSSLARTLARAHGLDERNDDLNAEHPPQFTDRHALAQALHPYPAVPTEALRRVVADRTALRKLHLFPTPAVLAGIAGTPVVVLLRDPDAIVDAEFRGVVTGIHPLAPGLPRTASIRRWRAAARTGGLVTSLADLAEGWRTAAAERPELLVVTHAELVRDPDRVLAATAAHLGLPRRPGLELLRERYSGPIRMRAGGALVDAAAGPVGVAGALIRRGWRGVRRRVAARSFTPPGRAADRRRNLG